MTQIDTGTYDIVLHFILDFEGLIVILILKSTLRKPKNCKCKCNHLQIIDCTFFPNSYVEADKLSSSLTPRCVYTIKIVISLSACSHSFHDETKNICIGLERHVVTFLDASDPLQLSLRLIGGSDWHIKSDYRVTHKKV